MSTDHVFSSQLTLTTNPDLPRKSPFLCSQMGNKALNRMDVCMAHAITLPSVWLLCRYLLHRAKNRWHFEAHPYTFSPSKTIETGGSRRANVVCFSPMGKSVFLWGKQGNAWLSWVQSWTHKWAPGYNHCPQLCALPSSLPHLRSNSKSSDSHQLVVSSGVHIWAMDSSSCFGLSHRMSEKRGLRVVSRGACERVSWKWGCPLLSCGPSFLAGDGRHSSWLNS